MVAPLDPVCSTSWRNSSSRSRVSGNHKNAGHKIGGNLLPDRSDCRRLQLYVLFDYCMDDWEASRSARAAAAFLIVDEPLELPAKFWSAETASALLAAETPIASIAAC